VVGTGELDELRTWHTLGDVSSFVDRDYLVVSLVQDERRDTDRRQDVAHVHLEEHPDERYRGTRARRETLELREPLLEALVANERRGEQLEEHGPTAPVLLYVLELCCLCRIGCPRIDRTLVAQSCVRAVHDRGTGSGVIREREALRILAHAGWIDARVEGTTLKIRRGDHAKKVREGKKDEMTVA
jgi:hypothetical protein